MRRTINILRCTIMALMLILIPEAADAQKWSVSTNLLSWASLGTINAEGSYSLSQHVSLSAGAAANPWGMLSTTGIELKNRHYTGYVGVKYWPWHVFSEWWIGAKVQYRNFEQTGIFTSQLVAGEAVGAGLSGGYSFMLGNHFNLDLGVGVWGGRHINYTKYEGVRRVEGQIKEEGGKYFFFLDNLILSLTYIF